MHCIIKHVWSGFVTAWRTLTILRLPGRDAQCFAQALPFFPVVGCILGCIAALAAWAGLCVGGVAFAGIMSVGLTTLCTGALHLDGLADGADGLYGHHTRERRLEIMKDPRIGTMGAVALFFVLLLKIFAVSRLAGFGAWCQIVLPCVWSRTAMVGLAVSMPYARRDGTAQGFVEHAKPIHVAVAILLAIAGFGWITSTATLLCALAATTLALLLRRVFMQAVGGLTGDLLGFSSETIETALLLGLSLIKGAHP